MKIFDDKFRASLKVIYKIFLSLYISSLFHGLYYSLLISQAYFEYRIKLLILP